MRALRDTSWKTILLAILALAGTAAHAGEGCTLESPAPDWPICALMHPYVVVPILACTLTAATAITLPGGIGHHGFGAAALAISDAACPSVR